MRPRPTATRSSAAAIAGDPWPRFARDLVGAAALLGLGVVAFVAALDPYGLRAAPGLPPGPIVDANQRLSYPQIARGGPFDSAVFGTSTARLLDPQHLDAALGGRFANLSVNAATPDEQLRLAALFLDRRPLRAALFALDATWCAAYPPARTANAFPDWLYEPGTPGLASGAVLRQANLRGVSAAVQAGTVRLGLARPRIRPDGYAVFTPPESAYDPARAGAYIHEGAADPAGPAEPVAAPMPALDRLDATLRAMPRDAIKIIAFMPVHAAAQAPPGTPAALREAACKARVARIGSGRGAVVVDFRLASSLTTRDANYWDALHYRVPVAAQVVAGLAAAVATGADDPGGVYRVLAHP